MSGRPLMLVVVAAICGCAKAPPTGPVEIRLGEDACDSCHMFVSERAYAAQLRTSDGRVEVFDDIGCLFERIAAAEPAAAYVVDSSGAAWIDARSASFVLSKDLKTPMASGLAAYASREKATEAASRLHGRALTYAEVPSARKE